MHTISSPQTDYKRRSRAIIEVANDKLVLLPIADSEEEATAAMQEIIRLIRIGDLCL